MRAQGFRMFGSEGVCVPCQLGQYCPSGTFTLTTSTMENRCRAGQLCQDPRIQLACPAGTFCPEGTFVEGMFGRTRCDNGNWAGFWCPENSSEPATCPAGFFCPDELTLEPCPAGYYCPSMATAPSPCLFPAEAYVPTFLLCGPNSESEKAVAVYPVTVGLLLLAYLLIVHLCYRRKAVHRQRRMRQLFSYTVNVSVKAPVKRLDRRCQGMPVCQGP